MTAPTTEPTTRWTIADLDVMPRAEGTREEIIEGELIVSTQPDWQHQFVCVQIAALLSQWMGGDKGMVLFAPGVIFDKENAVAPDVVWVSAERLPTIFGEDGKLHGAPDLAVEVLSPGNANVRRDREWKFRLYSLRGVREYWIVNWQDKTVQIYRRENAALRLTATLLADDELASPLLPGFSVRVARLFPG